MHILQVFFIEFLFALFGLSLKYANNDNLLICWQSNACKVCINYIRSLINGISQSISPNTNLVLLQYFSMFFIFQNFMNFRMQNLSIPFNTKRNLFLNSHSSLRVEMSKNILVKVSIHIYNQN